MLFNPVLSYFKLQLSALSLMHSAGTVAFELAQMPIQSLQPEKAEENEVLAENIEQNVIPKPDINLSKAPDIRKWFSENAVATEQDTQDIFDDRLPNRRIYSGFGQTPDAPSAIAVLERHKARQKIRAV